MSTDSKILQFTRLSDEILIEMPVVENEEFKDDTVLIDFKRYRNCDFENCTIVLEWGICSMSHCEFHSCTFIAKPGSPASFVLTMNNMLLESAKRQKDAG